MLNARAVQIRRNVHYDRGPLCSAKENDVTELRDDVRGK